MFCSHWFFRITVWFGGGGTAVLVFFPAQDRGVNAADIGFFREPVERRY